MKRPTCPAECYDRITDAIDMLKSLQGAALAGMAEDHSDRVRIPADVLTKVAEARAALDVAASIMERGYQRKADDPTAGAYDVAIAEGVATHGRSQRESE